MPIQRSMSPIHIRNSRKTSTQKNSRWYKNFKTFKRCSIHNITVRNHRNRLTWKLLLKFFKEVVLLELVRLEAAVRILLSLRSICFVPLILRWLTKIRLLLFPFCWMPWRVLPNRYSLPEIWTRSISPRRKELCGSIFRCWMIRQRIPFRQMRRTVALIISTLLKVTPRRFQWYAMKY